MGLSWIKMAFRYRFYSCYYSDSVRISFPGVRGLSNYSLSCCINALLQSFSVTPELLELLNKWHPSEEVELNNVPVQLRKALFAMKDQTNTSPHIDFLKCLHRHSIHRMHLTRFAVHDADEIFHNILNLIQKQMLDKGLAEEIRKLFEIKVETQVMCQECREIQKVPSSLFSLPLAIHTKNNTLESCIQTFSQQQTLMDGERCYCNRCNKKQPSTHQLKLVSLPAVLCVHLKRFRNHNGYTKKLYSKVTFPKTLNMDIFEAGQSENADEYYSLYAVIVHIGSASFGHYTAYIQHSHDQTWFYADDSKVYAVTWEDVQDTYEGENTAYLLLYRRMSRSTSG